MKKRILFVSYPMVYGGVERALLAALRLLPSELFDITLLLTGKHGALLDEVPKHIKICEVPFHPLDRYMLYHGRSRTCLRALLTLKFGYLFSMLKRRIEWFLHGRKGYFNEIILQDAMKRIDASLLPRDFDFALAYGGEYLVLDIVHRFYLKTPITAVWYHNERGCIFDYYYKNIAKAMTYRFACSDSMKHELETRPFVNDGDIAVMPHQVDAKRYKELAKGTPSFADDFSGLRILTIARITYQKGIDYAMECAKFLAKNNVNFRWYFIGEGDELEAHKATVLAYNLQNHVIFLGGKTNPFPYYKDCDLYIQPSRWEAYCLTVAEARVFAKPILATDFAGAREQLKDNITGLIIPPENQEELNKAALRLATDANLRKKLSNALEEENKTLQDNVKLAWQNFLGVTW